MPAKCLTTKTLAVRNTAANRMSRSVAAPATASRLQKPSAITIPTVHRSRALRFRRWEGRADAACHYYICRYTQMNAARHLLSVSVGEFISAAAFRFFWVQDLLGCFSVTV